MDVILDTCAFLYLCTDNPKLSAKAKLVILNGQNRRLLSIASIWEMAIKANPYRKPETRLLLSKPLNDFITEYLHVYRIEVIPIEMESLSHVAVLPEIHADPFDRLIIAQSIVMSIPIVTEDSKFEDYGVDIIW